MLKGHKHWHCTADVTTHVSRTDHKRSGTLNETILLRKGSSEETKASIIDSDCWLVEIKGSEKPSAVSTGPTSVQRS